MIQIINNTYRILDTVGKGGMSTVYKAEHLRLGTVWAVKQVSKNQKAKFDFLAEANILKKLKHPMLPKIVDIFEDENFLYVVEDFVEGENLENILKRQKRFDEKTGIVWFKQIAECLGYLHSQKPNPIIYRDMKPSNIMIQPDGSLKLIDFGIAREYKEESVADTTFIGTKGYAAPEQAGKSQSDARTDIYSLGVTMYHILSGKSPYEPPYSFVPIRQLNSELSVGIEMIIDRCVQQEPENRYNNTRELIEDLNHIYRYDEEYQKIKHKEKMRKVKLIIMSFCSICMILLGFMVSRHETSLKYNEYISAAQSIIESQPKEAFKYLDAATKLDNTQDIAYILKASAYYYDADYEECISYIQDTIINRGNLKNNSSLLSILASAYFETADYIKALQYYEQIIEQTEIPDENLLRDYAVTLAMNGNTDKANIILEELREEGADQGLIAYISGSIYYSLKDYDLAEEQLKEAVNISNSSNMIRKSAVLLALMYRDSAVDGFAEARTTEINFINNVMQTKGLSNDATLWEMLGEAYYNRAIYESGKDYEDLIKAADAFQQILDLNIQKKYIYVNLFIAYQQAKEYDLAMSILNEMEEAYPDAYEANAYRATLLIMIENGKPQEQRDYWKAYEEYQTAEKKLTAEDSDSLFVQLDGLIKQLKSGHWLD